MSITLAHDGLPENKSRKHLDKLIDAVGEAVFGFSEKTILLLKHYIWKCGEADFLPGRICGMWEQPYTTAQTFRISTRALSYKEQELEEAGLILRTGTAHASRTGKRVGDKIVFLAGINIGPMINRFEELEDMLAIQRQLDKSLPLLRAQISEALAKIRASGEPILIAEADAHSCGGRTKRITNVERLEGIKTALEALQVQHELRSGAKFTSDRSEAHFAPNIPSKSIRKINTPAALSKAASDDLASITPKVAIRLASEVFQTNLSLIGVPSWPNVVEAARLTALQNGITQWVWGEACSKLGKEQAALCVLAIDRNSKLPPNHPFHCNSPAGALFMMSRKAGGQFNLNGLLRAIQGYQEGDCRAVAPEPISTAARPLEGVRQIGNALPDYLAHVQIIESREQV